MFPIVLLVLSLLPIVAAGAEIHGIKIPDSVTVGEKQTGRESFSRSSGALKLPAPLFLVHRRPAKYTLSMALSESGPLQARWIICGITVILSPDGAF